MQKLERTVNRLCEISRKDFANPFEFEWPDTLAPDEGWFTSPELISLFGTPFYDRITEQQKKILSFHEAAKFFSLNIHGEKALIEGLARRLYESRNKIISSYLHHFLDEENKHMIYFGEFCNRYAGKIYPDRKIAFERDYAEGEEDFLFFAKVLVFEEVVDVFNVRMSQDERLIGVAREINRMHHRDEARHLVFGRQLVIELFEHFKTQWNAETLEGIRSHLSGYLSAMWKEYYNPDVYRDSGFPDPYKIAESAFEHPACHEFRKAISSGCVRYLMKSGILTEEPVL